MLLFAVVAEIRLRTRRPGVRISQGAPLLLESDSCSEMNIWLFFVLFRPSRPKSNVVHVGRTFLSMKVSSKKAGRRAYASLYGPVAHWILHVIRGGTVRQITADRQ